MSKMTGAERTYNYVKTLPVGKTFTNADVKKRVPDSVTSSAISNMLGIMRNQGFLKRIPNTFNWVVTEKTAEFGAHHKFVSSYKTRSKKVAVSPKLAKAFARRDAFLKRREAREAETMSADDLDIIDTLLDAMAKAEPVLRKYKKMHHVLADFIRS